MLTANGCCALTPAPGVSRWVMFGGWQPTLVVTTGRDQPPAMQKHSRFGFPRRRTETDFERLVRPHLDHLYKLAYRFTGAVDRAEDLIQELLVRLYSRRNELAKVQLLRPWLVRVMYRLFVDQTRREARAPYISLADSDFGTDKEDGDPYADVADPTPGPDIEVELNLDRERLVRAWQELSAEHRAVLALHEIEGHTLEELEMLLDLNRGTVKSRLHRARARLAQLLVTEPFDAAERVKDKRKA
jgi:RNA polymerase sigma factor (sigma-70 family)